jgi:hypothetical protein
VELQRITFPYIPEDSILQSVLREPQILDSNIFSHFPDICILVKFQGLCFSTLGYDTVQSDIWQEHIVSLSPEYILTWRLKAGIVKPEKTATAR